MSPTNTAIPIPVMVSWSSGKDSAWALHTLRQQPERYDVRGIFTTVTTTFDRIAIHAQSAAATYVTYADVVAL